MEEAPPDGTVRTGGPKRGAVVVPPKPLGTGVLTTALKRDLLSEADVAPAIAAMTMLNAGAARAMLAMGTSVHAATDVTGFGLLGHLRTLLDASGVAAEVTAAAVPLLPRALEAAERGAIPGGTTRNVEGGADAVTFAAGGDRTPRLLLADAQPSGG